MKRQADISSFTAGSGGAGTVVFGTIAPTDIKQILLITDVTSQTIIYNPFDSTKGGTYNSGTKTLTLEANTTGLTGTSLLAFFWDEAAGFGQKTMANSAPVVIASDQSALTLAASENHIGEVGGRTVVVSASFTRPANTTAYAAKDVVSNSTSSPVVITFSNVSRISGGSGYITKVRLMTDQSTNVAAFRLHLFNTSPTAINDNDPFTLLWANRSSRVGYVDFDNMTTEGTGSDSATTLNKDIRLAFSASGSRDIFGILETNSVFTPASGQNFFIELTVELN